MNFDTPKKTEFYIEYHRIGSRAYRDKVRYYEDNTSHLNLLTYEERVEIEIDYAICLFEIGKYHKFLSKVDTLIETVIIDNIYNYNGRNIYNDLLFKKAACLFNTGQYIKSEKVLKANINLDPENNIARALYGKCKRKQVRAWHDTLKNIALVMIIAGVVITAIQVSSELLLSTPLLENYSYVFNGIKNFMFISGSLIIVGNEMYLQYLIGREIGFKFNIEVPKQNETTEDT